MAVPLGSRRRAEAAERTTAVYLSLGLHALLGIGVAFYSLADRRVPTVTEAIEVLAVGEPDPLWRGRQMRRETLVEAGGAAPQLKEDTSAPETSPSERSLPEPAAVPAAETVAALGPPPGTPAVEPRPPEAVPAARPPPLKGQTAAPRVAPAPPEVRPLAPAVDAPAGAVAVSPSGEEAFVGFEAPTLGPVRAPRSDARVLVGDAPRTAEPVAADGARILARSGGFETATTLEAVATDEAGTARAPKTRGEALPEAAAPHSEAAPVATIEAITPADGAVVAAAEAGDRDRPQETGRAEAAAPVEAAAAAAPEAAAAKALAAPRPAAPLPAVADAPSITVSAEAAPVPDQDAAERLLAGLVPPARPAGSEATAARLASLLGSVDCGQLSGRLDAATGTLVLTGNVPTTDDRDRLVNALARLKGVSAVRRDGVVVLPRPHCRILDTLRQSGLTPSAAHQGSPAMLADPAGAGIRRFVDGEPIDVRLTTPRYPAFVYADFYDRSGRVYHLLPNARQPHNWFQPGRVLSVGDGSQGVRLRAAPPFGIGVVVAIGSSARLFDRPRPVVEDAGTYLAALREGVGRARAATAGFKQEYVYVFVVTGPRSGGLAGGQAGAGK